VSPDVPAVGGNPTLVYGYGAYGSSVDPDFLVSWYALINSGFVFAIAHVRELEKKDWPKWQHSAAEYLRLAEGYRARLAEP